MTPPRLIITGYLIDGSGSPARKNVVLVVEGGRIVAIEPLACFSRPAGAIVDDLTYCTVLPALVDCSIDLTRSPAIVACEQAPCESARAESKATLFARHLRYCHMHGVLGAADSGEIADIDELAWQQTARENFIILRKSGRIIRNLHHWTMAGASRHDFVKIGYSANIEDESSPLLRVTPEDLRHILGEHGDGKTVVVANGRQAVAEALAVGCDAIEQGYGMGEENLKVMAMRNILWIPSLLRAKNALDGAGSGGDVCCRFSLRYVAPGKQVPGAEAFWKKMLADQLAQLRLARSLGVPTAVGTGAGSTGILHGEAMVEEMKLFIKAGYSLEETIRCATDSGARFFNMHQLGALTVGSRATFLLTRGTPHQLPRKLSYLEGVYMGGMPSSHYRKQPTRTA